MNAPRVSRVDILHSLHATQRHLAALRAALTFGDDIAALVASTRVHGVAGQLHSALSAIERLDDADPLLTVLEATTDDAAELLSLAPRTIHQPDGARIARWFQRAGSLDVGSETEPDLFEVNLAESGAHVDVSRLRIAHSNFRAATLTRSSFSEAILEDCDLSRADLRSTSWYGARLVRCSLRDAQLTDALLSHAHLVDCDLRGAELRASVDLRSAFARNAVFTRCDLRESTWHGVSRVGVTFESCTLDSDPGLAH